MIPPAHGYGAAKRAAGRKRHILVGATGLVLLAYMQAADLHDRLGAQALVRHAAAGDLPRLELACADGAYASTFARWPEAERGWRVEVPKHRVSVTRHSEPAIRTAAALSRRSEEGSPDGRLAPA